MKLTHLYVITELNAGEEHIPFPFQSAPMASRLALIRDNQLYYVLNDQHKLRDLIIEALNNMELIDEVNRLTEDKF